MRHKIKLSIKEKVRRWLELCDFTYHLMKSALTPQEFKKRWEKMREEHLQRDFRLLEKLARIK